jgi:hypothetical protein
VAECVLAINGFRIAGNATPVCVPLINCCTYVFPGPHQFEEPALPIKRIPP